MELSERLKDDFNLTLKRYLREEEYRYILLFFKGQRWEVLVKADTLAAFLSAYRAVLFQKVRASFTRRDMKLREILLSYIPVLLHPLSPGPSATSPPSKSNRDNVDVKGPR